MQCPKCGSENVIVQREQTASIGVGTNKVVIEPPKKSKGCLYWLCFGWMFQFIYWMLFGFWKNLFFGKKTEKRLECPCR